MADIGRARRATALLALTLVAGAAGLSACGGEERSPQAYCGAFYSRAAPMRQVWVDQTNDRNANPLTGLIVVLSAPGQLETVFDGMVDHAPDDIKPETVQARDAFKQTEDNMGKSATDPIGGFASALATSLSSAGSFNKVDAYLNANCPVSSPLAQKYIRAAR
jgi:hypothetical protein